MTITAEEEELLNASMAVLAPGFRMYREAEFKKAVGRAMHALKHEKALYTSELMRPQDMSLALLLRRVLTDPRQDGYGVPFAWWWIAFEKHLLVGITQDPWSEVKWWLWISMRGKGEVLTMHGCQNSAKTAFMGRFAVVQMCVWLEDAEVYISGPFKLHTDDKAWRDLKTWIEHVGRNPNIITKGLSLRFISESDKCFVTDTRTGLSATARFISLETASAAQGKKSSKHDESGLRGIVLLIVDEFIENPQLKLKQAEGNTASNYNFFCLLGCNPRSEAVQHPALLKFSEPSEINSSSLRRDTHFRWKTAYGWCVRFAWANCPNNLLGRTVWPYLLSETRIERARRKGNDVIDAQVEAWAWGTGARNAPLDEAAIRMAGTMARHVEDFTWQGPTSRVIHIDCAFGGHDPATATILEAGEASIAHTTEGNNYITTRRVLYGVEQRVIKVDPDFHATDEWIEEMNFLFGHSGGAFPHTTGTLPIKAGDRMGGNWHLCGQVLRLLFELDIPSTHCSFDASQRGDCVAPMLDCLGRQNVRWFYEGSRKLVDEEGLPPAQWYKWPYEYEEVKDSGELAPIKWSAYCSQTISMIWFFACNLIRHGYLVGGENVQKGLDELCARPVVRGRHGQTEGRRDVLGKQALKDMGQSSPTWGEGLATALYFSCRFHSLVDIEGPKLSTTVTVPVTPMSIIRAPGMNRRYGARSDHSVELEAALATIKPLEYKPMTPQQRAMNALVDLSR